LNNDHGINLVLDETFTIEKELNVELRKSPQNRGDEEGIEDDERKYELVEEGFINLAKELDDR
jgi:hypothetical protein